MSELHDDETYTTTILVRDTNGNTLGRMEADIEADRIEGASVSYRHPSGVVVLTLDLAYPEEEPLRVSGCSHAIESDCPHYT